MEINESIFKAYDIRGIYPSELNEETAYLIGRALVRIAGVKRIVIGSDMRLSGPVLKEKLIEGITDEGVDVKDIGLVSIDAIYYCMGKLGDETGVMITASHNPKEYNGFKILLKGMQWLDSLDVLEEIKKLPKLTNKKKGVVIKEDVTVNYINHILNFVDVDKINPSKVVVDAGNGMAGKIIPILTESLPVNIVPLNFKLDGSFPAHPSNPLLPESQKQICETVVREKADFGVIFDGDADRIIFVDEKGKFIRPDITLLLLAKLFLQKEPGAAIGYNIVCSRIVPEMVRKWGGKPVVAKVGNTSLAEVMKANNAVVGGETSSHYSFRDNSYLDSGFVAFLIFLQILSEYQKSLSEILEPFDKYFKSEGISLKVDEKRKEFIMKKLGEKYSDGEIDFIDGMRIQYKNWWFSVRMSNTEPLLRLTIEADKKVTLEQKEKELIKCITG